MRNQCRGMALKVKLNKRELFDGNMENNIAQASLQRGKIRPEESSVEDDLFHGGIPVKFWSKSPNSCQDLQILVKITKFRQNCQKVDSCGIRKDRSSYCITKIWTVFSPSTQ